jgi:hypothetical protein
VDDAIALVRTDEDGALLVSVNFGILAGRIATPAELEELGHELVSAIDHVSVVSEDRFEVGQHAEAEVHQVRIEIEGDSVNDALRDRVVATAERWARACAAERHAELTDL